MTQHASSRPLPAHDRDSLSESGRTRLIAEIASLLHDTAVPAEAKSAGLTLIGWLARRMPDDGPVPSAARQSGSGANGQSVLAAGEV